MATVKVRHHPGIFRDVERGTPTGSPSRFRAPTADAPDRRRGFASIQGSRGGRDELERACVRYGHVVVPQQTDDGQLPASASWLPMLTRSARPRSTATGATSIATSSRRSARSCCSSSTGRRWRRGWPTLSASGLAPKTVRNIVDVLDGSTRRRRRARPRADERRAATQEPAGGHDTEAKGVDDRRGATTSSPTCRRDRWYPLWRFLAVTGCRRGEALGLQVGRRRPRRRHGRRSAVSARSPAARSSRGHRRRRTGSARSPSTRRWSQRCGRGGPSSSRNVWRWAPDGRATTGCSAGRPVSRCGRRR